MVGHANLSTTALHASALMHTQDIIVEQVSQRCLQYILLPIIIVTQTLLYTHLSGILLSISSWP